MPYLAHILCKLSPGLTVLKVLQSSAYAAELIPVVTKIPKVNINALKDFFIFCTSPSQFYIQSMFFLCIPILSSK